MAKATAKRAKKTSSPQRNGEGGKKDSQENR